LLATALDKPVPEYCAPQRDRVARSGAGRRADNGHEEPPLNRAS
jgi:hypothetical protein